MPEGVKITAARNEQSKASKKATLQRLRDKKPRLKTVEISLDGDVMEMTFRALSSHDLDALQGKHAPSVEQKSKGMSFNSDTFAPALVAACSYDPEMTEAEAKEIWTSDSFSTGELSYLFGVALDLCMEGLNVPFSASV